LREDPSDLIGEGIDLEVRLAPVSGSSLVCRRIGWTTAFLCAAPSYVERCGVPKAPAEGSAHEFICYSRAGDGRSWLFSDGSDEIAVRISPRLVANSALAVHRAVMNGGGLAVLSHILASPDIEAGRLINAMPDFPPVRLPINLVYPSRKNLPLRVRTVLDFLVAAIREDPLMAS